MLKKHIHPAKSPVEPLIIKVLAGPTASPSTSTGSVCNLPCCVDGDPENSSYVNCVLMRPTQAQLCMHRVHTGFCIPSLVGTRRLRPQKVKWPPQDHTAWPKEPGWRSPAFWRAIASLLHSCGRPQGTTRVWLPRSFSV